jgi:hypothetical protein
MRHEYADVNGVRLHYVTVGEGNEHPERVNRLIRGFLGDPATAGQ